VIVRRPSEEDLDAVLALLQEADRVVYGASDWTADDLLDEWRELDLDRNAWLAELDGSLAGVMHLYGRDGERYEADGYVHPAHVGRGVGGRLLDLAETRALELQRDAPDGERSVLSTAHLVGDPHAPGLLARKGFSRVRTFFRMVVDLDAPVAAPAMPEGLELRPLDVERDGPVTHRAVEEAFVDEWSFRPRPYDEWAERVFGWPRFDPALVPAVWEGEELAAISINYWKRMGEWGWIGTLAVRPAWRRRGLGLGLLQESFRRFQDRGETTVALGVDSENPTGATRLYERAGMRVLWQADVWEKELAASLEVRSRALRAETRL
jgi:ribosomal protein S18 acetylase RimI-like enzyme